MTKPSLVKVRALFYVLQHVTKKEAAPIFDTASFFVRFAKKQFNRQQRMKSLKVMLLGASLLMLSACGQQVQKESEGTVTEKSNSEAVIETILSRRSVRILVL